MTPELAYFLKINIGIALFYAFYRLFFYRDTFFHWRRYALLAFLITSLLYPFMNIQEWVKEQEPINEIVTIYATNILPEVGVVSQKDSMWTLFIRNAVPVIYWVGTGLLLLRFLIQLISISILAFRCRKADVNGITVRILKKPSSPFSFFQWIFISPELHSEKEAKEILIHEETHARQWHSIDVIFCELINILCWINPFSWLLKREVRNNLEYMADNRVILSGHDTKSYQYHLLGLANQKAAANLYNSFNVLPLKNRITMMNKKRTKNIGKTKYAIFIPLAALLMLISNIEAVARVTYKLAENFSPSSLADNNINAEVISDFLLTRAVQANDSVSPKSGKVKVFTVVEQMPRFPGGEAVLLEYIFKNLKYPAQSRKNGVQGKVYVRFIVTKTGDIGEVKIMRSLDKFCNAEAIRVIKEMPKWIPGKQNGKEVSVYYVIPIKFSLEKDKSMTKNEISIKKDTSEEPYTAVQEMPQFPGGEAALLEYIFKNLRYPIQSQKSGVQGKVYVRITISENGDVKDPTIMRSLDSYCDKEAIRVMKSLPRWIPGKQNGINVPVYFVIPITFKLS